MLAIVQTRNTYQNGEVFIMTSKQDEKRWQDTLDALESVKEGKVIDGKKVHDWLESWGTAQEQKRFDGMRNLDD